MSAPRTNAPSVTRVGALATLAILLTMVATVVAVPTLLDHPRPGGAPMVVAELTLSDPRTEVVCPVPEGREGERRLDPGAPASGVSRVSSNQLYECPQTWDGRLVRLRGEVVGAVLERNGGAWTQLNDDVFSDPQPPLPGRRDLQGSNAGVGVFIGPELQQRIGSVGGPSVRGDLVEIIGRFHRVDPRSGEVAIIRATTGRVVTTGSVLTAPDLPDRRVAAALLVPLALALVAAERWRAWRR